jgi:N-acetylneuraminic acid mutarotase
LGGKTTGDSKLSTIYHYNPEEDSWTLLDSRLKEGKSDVIAMLVDREMLEAND